MHIGKKENKMQSKNMLRNLTVALPMLALAACSSTDSATDAMNSSDLSTNAPMVEEVVVENVAIVTPLEDTMGGLTEQEIRNNELRKDYTIFFNFNEFTILPKFDEMLDAHAAYLRDNPNVTVIVEGFTDERGTPEYNIVLGEKRAMAVSKYLQAMGVTADQISIVSYGEEKPAVLGHTELDYAKNRRAILVY
jgi:peptidoglycan-associated lipoprotein